MSGVGVLDKAVRLVELVCDGPAALSVLVERSGFSRATTHRLAQALEAHGLVRRDDLGRYVPGFTLLRWGQHATASMPFLDGADAVLAELRDRTGESVQLYVREDGGRRCLLALEGPHELRTIVEPGALLPLHRGSAGRVLGGEAVGAKGWIETVGEREEGVASVSAPIRDHAGNVIAALSVSGPIGRIGRSPGRRHGKAVTAAAARLEANGSAPAARG